MTTRWWPSNPLPNCHFYYLHNSSEGVSRNVAKLYFMHGCWNISIKDRQREQELREMCERKIVEITLNKLEGK